MHSKCWASDSVAAGVHELGRRSGWFGNLPDPLWFSTLPRDLLAVTVGAHVSQSAKNTLRSDGWIVQEVRDVWGEKEWGAGSDNALWFGEGWEVLGRGYASNGHGRLHTPSYVFAFIYPKVNT